MRGAPALDTLHPDAGSHTVLSTLRLRRATLVAVAASAAALSTAPARAQQPAASTARLLVNTNPAGLLVYDGLHYGGGVWRGVTATLDAAYGSRITQVATLSDRGALLGYDALWVDQRWHHSPGANEIDNLRAFVETGRRVVLVGENASWGAWNQSLLSALGGAEGPLAGRLPNEGGQPGPGCQDGAAGRVFDHALTQGVARINMACAGFAVGGTALFDYNVATLWGTHQNVLTLLDANVLDDRYGVGYDGRQFRRNVVEWLAAPPTASAALTAPEPGTWALLGTGLVVVGGVARGRRRR